MTHTIDTHHRNTHHRHDTHTRATSKKQKSASTPKPTAQRTYGQTATTNFFRAQHNTPSTQHTIDTTHHRHNTPLTQHTINTTHHRHIQGTVHHLIEDSGMCFVVMPSSSIVSIHDSLDTWLWLPTLMSMQVPRLLLMVPLDCLLATISIPATESGLFSPISRDHLTTSETNTLLKHLMYPAPTNLVSFVDAVSSCGSLVLCTRGVLFQTPKKVGAIVSSAPAENNKGTGSMRLDARATYLCHCKTLMTDNLEGGIEKRQMISFGKYMLS